MEAEVTEKKTERYTFTAEDIVGALNMRFRLTLSTSDTMEVVHKGSKQISSITFLKWVENRFDPTKV